jgi:integrase
VFGLGFLVMCYFSSIYATKLAGRQFRVKRILRKDFRNLRLAIVAKNREIRTQRVHLIDIPEAMAQVLRRYTEGKDGYLFTTRAGRLLDQRNALKALHVAGNRGGFHAFRRFRFAVLRKAGVPENLIKRWMGHSQNLMDLYAAQLRLDVAYRREWCERAGLGFELGELGYKVGAPIRPSLVA